MNNSKITEGKYNLYTAENIPDTHKEYYKDQFEGSWSENRINDYDDYLLNNGVIMYKCIKDTSEVYTKPGVYESKTTYYIDSAILIHTTNNGTYFTARKDNSSGRYFFFPYWDEMPSRSIVTHESIKQIKKDKGLNEPNRVGVFTDKKFNDWAQYCEKLHAYSWDYFNSLQDDKESRDKEINDFINSLPSPTVTRSNDGLKIWIDSKPFYIVLSLSKDSPYVSKDISFRGDLDDVSNILNKVQK